jgi:hypothetical protein
LNLEVAVAKYQILYWHDIPRQGKAQEGHARASRPLSDRFQIAVDNASMEAGLTGTDEYLNLMQWSEVKEREGTPDAVADALVAELELKYAKIEWRKTAEALKGKQ